MSLIIEKLEILKTYIDTYFNEPKQFELEPNNFKLSILPLFSNNDVPDSSNIDWDNPSLSDLSQIITLEPPQNSIDSDNNTLSENIHIFFTLLHDALSKIIPPQIELFSSNIKNLFISDLQEAADTRVKNKQPISIKSHAQIVEKETQTSLQERATEKTTQEHEPKKVNVNAEEVQESHNIKQLEVDKGSKQITSSTRLEAEHDIQKYTTLLTRSKANLLEYNNRVKEYLNKSSIDPLAPEQVEHDFNALEILKNIEDYRPMSNQLEAALTDIYAQIREVETKPSLAEHFGTIVTLLTEQIENAKLTLTEASHSLKELQHRISQDAETIKVEYKPLPQPSEKQILAHAIDTTKDIAHDANIALSDQINLLVEQAIRSPQELPVQLWSVIKLAQTLKQQSEITLKDAILLNTKLSVAIGSISLQTTHLNIKALVDTSSKIVQKAYDNVIARSVHSVLQNELASNKHKFIMEKNNFLGEPLDGNTHQSAIKLYDALGHLIQARTSDHKVAITLEPFKQVFETQIELLSKALETTIFEGEVQDIPLDHTPHNITWNVFEPIEAPKTNHHNTSEKLTLLLERVQKQDLSHIKWQNIEMAVQKAIDALEILDAAETAFTHSRESLNMIAAYEFIPAQEAYHQHMQMITDFDAIKPQVPSSEPLDGVIFTDKDSILLSDDSYTSDIGSNASVSVEQNSFNINPTLDTLLLEPNQIEIDL